MYEFGYRPDARVKDFLRLSRCEVFLGENSLLRSVYISLDVSDVSNSRRTSLLHRS